MEKYKKTFGNLGEDAAVKYLKKKKYIILERNFNVQGGEIDIIAKKGDYVIFVEVKTRSGDEYGSGAEAVNYTKQQRMIKAAQVYLLRLGDVPAQFDVVVVNGFMDGKKFKTEEIEKRVKGITHPYLSAKFCVIAKLHEKINIAIRRLLFACARTEHPKLFGFVRPCDSVDFIPLRTYLVKHTHSKPPSKNPSIVLFPTSPCNSLDLQFTDAG